MRWQQPLAFARLVGRGIDRLLAAVLIGGVIVYKFTLSPLLGRHCRFQPTCSSYFRAAVEKDVPSAVPGGGCGESAGAIRGTPAATTRRDAVGASRPRRHSPTGMSPPAEPPRDAIRRGAAAAPRRRPARRRKTKRRSVRWRIRPARRRAGGEPEWQAPLLQGIHEPQPIPAARPARPCHRETHVARERRRRWRSAGQRAHDPRPRRPLRQSGCAPRSVAPSWGVSFGRLLNEVEEAARRPHDVVAGVDMHDLAGDAERIMGEQESPGSPHLIVGDVAAHR